MSEDKQIKNAENSNGSVLDANKKNTDSQKENKEIVSKQSVSTKKEDSKNKSEIAGEKVAKSIFGQNVKKKAFRKGRGFKDQKKDDFEQRILDLARVTRVMAGGKRMSFRACVVIGDRKGKVGVGLGKGADVTIAVNKAVNRAKKTLVHVPMVRGTVPHEVYLKKGAAKLLLKPAARGRGVIAGGVVRTILELAGVKNVACKILGTNNKINNADCTIEALKMLKRIENKETTKK